MSKTEPNVMRNTVTAVLAATLLAGCASAIAKPRDAEGKAFAQAQSLVAKGKAEQAIPFAEQAVAGNPRDAAARPPLGQAYLRARRVESALRSLEGIEEINSTVREGNSTTQVSFVIGTPLDRAVTDMRDAISQIRSDLPDGILEPQIQRIVANGGGEILPEIAQHLLPVELAIRYAVELFFEVGGEIIFDIAAKERFQKCRHHPPLVLGDQALLVDPHVTAVTQRRQDRHIGRWPADA